MKNHKRRLVLIALGAVVLGVGAGIGWAAIPGGNLIQNPGGESDAGASDTATVVVPSAWKTNGPFTTVRYGTPGGFPTTAVAARIGGGANFFAGGNAAVSSAEQVIDVADATSEIDAGRARARLSALLGGYQTQGDAAKVDVVYLSASSGRLGGLQVGPVTEADRGSETTFVNRSAEGAIPRGTRQLRVVVTAIRVNGTYNDGYADSVSVAISQSSGPAQKPKLSVRCAGKLLVATVTAPPGQAITSVTFAMRTGNRSKQIGDAKPPFSARFATTGYPKRLRVTATVRLVGTTVVLKSSSNRC